jgi:RHS repeat-associated protein
LSALKSRPSTPLSPRIHRGYRRVVRRAQWGRSHQNYLRDCYDPATGRYCQSDPLGLEAGVNPYIYVRNNPAMFDDPLGLFDVQPWDNAVSPPTTNCSCTIACMADPNRGGSKICKLIASRRIVIKGVPVSANPARFLCDSFTKAWSCESLCQDFCSGKSKTDPCAVTPVKSNAK